MILLSAVWLGLGLASYVLHIRVPRKACAVGDRCPEPTLPRKIVTAPLAILIGPLFLPRFIRELARSER